MKYFKIGTGCLFAQFLIVWIMAVVEFFHFYHFSETEMLFISIFVKGLFLAGVFLWVLVVAKMAEYIPLLLEVLPGILEALEDNTKLIACYCDSECFRWKVIQKQMQVRRDTIGGQNRQTAAKTEGDREIISPTADESCGNGCQQGRREDGLSDAE